MIGRRRQPIIVLVIYLGVTLSMPAGDSANCVGERDGALETMDPMAGIMSVRSRHKVA
jgi:hypothetical protein